MCLLTSSARPSNGKALTINWTTKEQKHGNRRHQTLHLVSQWAHTLLASPLHGRLWANMLSSTKLDICNVLLSEQDRTTYRDNMYRHRNFCEVWTCFLRYASGQTHRHTQCQGYVKSCTNLANHTSFSVFNWMSASTVQVQLLPAW